MGEIQSEPKKWSKPPGDIVREFFLDASDEDVEFILWERTGWPCFWGDDPETTLRQQLQEFKDAPDVRLCDFCNKPSLESGTLCASCEDGWQSLQASQRLKEVMECVAVARGQFQRP